MSPSTDRSGPSQIVVVVEDGCVVSVQGYRTPADLQAFVVLLDGPGEAVTLEGKTFDAQVYQRKVWPMGDQFEGPPEPGVLHAAPAVARGRH